MKLWVGRLLLVSSAILVIIAISSVMHYPSLHTITTKTYSTTETYDVEEIVTSSTYVTVVQEITLSHLTTRSLYEFSSNFDDELFALGMPVSFETVVETIKKTYSYTTGSYDKSYFTLMNDKINPILVETVLINTQSFFPPWIVIPCIITAIGLVSAFILMKYRTINRSMNDLGVLLLEDKYYCREELIGKKVFNSKAMKIGDVVNVGYSKNGQVALAVQIAKDNVKIISFKQINFIGDIILLSSKAEREKEFKDFKRSRLSEKDDNFLDNFFHAD